MRLLFQGEGTKTCGQTCVAMLSGRSVSNVIKVVGHNSGTHGSDLIKSLTALGVKCDKRSRHPIPKVLPINCILRIRYKDYPNGHWVVLHEGLIYDPSYRFGVIEIEHYKTEWLEYYKGRFTSYITVECSK